MNWRIPLADIDFGAEEKAAVQATLDSGWLTMGERTRAFEDDFASILGVRHGIAVTNATAALHLACLALDLGPGDEVIVPSLTFVATAASIRYTGAKPIFADIESDQNLNISIKSIESKISEKTRAIMVMHFAGYACDMLSILSIAKKYNLAVIEDAAHAPGAELHNKKLGTWGKVGCFSFFSNKNIVTGEGGMLVTNSDSIADRLRLLRSHGMTTLTWDRHRGHAWSYDVIALGYNYRIDEIRAAIGKIQIRKLIKNNERRRTLTSLYHNCLNELVPDVTIPFQNHPGISSCHILPILLPPGINRVQFMEQMKSRGIQTSVHYPPIHKFQCYRESDTAPLTLPVTEEVAAREVTLPLYPTLEPPAVEYVVQSVNESILELQWNGSNHE
ncbi:MAG: DegT/DnrJ/EryC1/StrS aminotransferase family protein [Anaerolineales bacterium]|nr:DegT/DnrJ/EryC1/StrS aminotransferase family protein [Anaerolineales bacterium]